MKAFISGPMTGLPEYNYPAFFEAEAILEEEGWEVLNPARLGDTDTYRNLLGKCLEMIYKEADYIFVLPNWENSKGAKAELALAEAIGLEIRYM